MEPARTEAEGTTKDELAPDDRQGPPDGEQAMERRTEGGCWLSPLELFDCLTRRTTWEKLSLSLRQEDKVQPQARIYGQTRRQSPGARIYRQTRRQNPAPSQNLPPDQKTKSSPEPGSNPAGNHIVRNTCWSREVSLYENSSATSNHC